MSDTNADELPVERAVKFVAPDTIEGLAIPFGGIPALKGKDTDAEAFDASTDLCLDWFPKRPVLYDHGLDTAHGAVKVGDAVEYEVREGGVWQQSQLARNAKYRRFIDELIEKDALGYSSGAYGHLARKNADGIITRWPWVETSLTPIPANPLALGVHYVKSADLLLTNDDIPPAVKAALEALDEWAATNSDSESLPDGLKVADLIDRLSVDGPAWVKARRDWYAKSGRVLSATTRERLMRHPASLRELASDLEDLLTEADAPKDGKSADLWLEAIQAEMTHARQLGVAFDSQENPT